VSRPKRGREFVRFVAVFAALLLLPLAIQAVFRPWARSFTGAPTLTGGWYGEGTTPSGQREIIYLTVSPFLWSNDEGACFRGCGFDGIAKVCAANKTVQPYEVQGDVDRLPLW